MNRKVFGGALCAMLLALSVSVAAQQPKKVPRIGLLTPGGEATLEPNREAFRQRLLELGYVEGKTITIEYRYAQGKFERLPELAEELVRLKVDIIVAASATAARAVKKVTTTIPIIVANAGDPIGSGLAATLARPGGNVTGLTNYTQELVGKRFELLKEVVPKVSRFAFLSDADSETSRRIFPDAQLAAQAFSVKLQLVEVKAPNPNFDGAFRVMAKDHIGALITSSGPLIRFHRKRILELVEQNRIAAIHPEETWVNAGGLMSYGANQADLYGRVATYVDKILKGAKPADLPVEQPMKFDLIINLKTAKQIGLTIPQSILFRADKVIK
jgi:putative tryptophan/tyrosine transport system substrate-binding protein